MHDTLSIDKSTSSGFPDVHKVSLWSAFAWLKAGAHDLRQAWTVSLAHGVLFAGLGWILVNWGWENSAHFALFVTSGFFMVAPLLAICFYDISRGIERGEKVVSLSRPIRLIQQNPWTLSMFVVMLAMLFSFWERLTAVIVAMTLKADVLGHGAAFSFLGTIASDPHQLPVVIGFFAVGAVFALIAFTLSAVSLPLMVDREVDIVTAIVTSVRAVVANSLPMLIWAVSITGLILVGYLTYFIGLIVIFPLLGHATWHAYRALVEQPKAA